MSMSITFMYLLNHNFMQKSGKSNVPVLRNRWEIDRPSWICRDIRESWGSKTIIYVEKVIFFVIFKNILRGGQIQASVYRYFYFTNWWRNFQPLTLENLNLNIFYFYCFAIPDPVRVTCLGNNLTHMTLISRYCQSILTRTSNGLS